MDRCLFPVRTLLATALTMLAIAAVAQTQADGPPFPGVGHGMFYASADEAETACKGDMAWQKTQLETEESGPRTRWHVTDQHCEFRTAMQTGMPANHYVLVNRIVETINTPGGHPEYRSSERTIERLTFMVVKPQKRKP